MDFDFFLLTENMDRSDNNSNILNCQQCFYMIDFFIPTSTFDGNSSCIAVPFDKKTCMICSPQLSRWENMLFNILIFWLYTLAVLSKRIEYFLYSFKTLRIFRYQFLHYIIFWKISWFWAETCSWRPVFSC